jgi:hypothetical protein
MTFKLKYLGELKFLFENNLEKESADQEHAFDEKNGSQKSHASVPLMCGNTHLQKFTTPG